LVQAVIALHAYVVGLVTETDSAFSTIWTKLKAVGLVTETDSAFPVEGGAAQPSGFVLRFPLFFPLCRSLIRRRRSPKPLWEQD
jgi:hypothetical protein